MLKWTLDGAKIEIKCQADRVKDFDEKTIHTLRYSDLAIESKVHATKCT